MLLEGRYDSRSRIRASAAGARPHDRGDLRDDAGGQGVAQEDVGVAAQRHDPLLDARPAGVVQADDRCPDLHGQVHDLADLGGVGLAERTAEYREVLGEHEHRPAVHGAVPGDDTVSRDELLVHAEVVAAVDDEAVELLEGARIEEPLYALAGGKLPLGLLALEALGPPARLGLAIPAPQLLKPVVAQVSLSASAAAASPSPSGISAGRCR